MLTADLNRDGKPEIIVGYVQAPGVIYFNDGTGRKYHRATFGDSKGAIYGLAAADLDGDGYPDIVAARSDAPSLALFSRPGNDARRHQLGSAIGLARLAAIKKKLK
jgi:hypothetical protein